jgi:PKD repeat protein/predicted small lipoprotein YifL
MFAIGGRQTMRQILLAIIAIITILAVTACDNNAPVWSPNQTPTTPPPGTDPGSTSYQLMCTIDLSATLGTAPLGVNMIGNVIGGTAPYYFRWDVDGDKEWDYGGLGVQEIGIHYASAGLYDILLEVEDSGGQSYRATALVDVKPSGPSSQPLAYPNQGPAPHNVTLDGNSSYDNDGYVVKWEWDFEPDGVYDFESDTTGITTFMYEFPGTYNPTLRVTDDDGFTDEASVQVIAL